MEILEAIDALDDLTRRDRAAQARSLMLDVEDAYDQLDMARAVVVEDIKRQRDGRREADQWRLGR